MPTDRRDTRITLADQPGELRLPDVLLSMPESDWLQPSSLPSRPLSHWNTGTLKTDVSLIKPSVPVIYGEQNLQPQAGARIAKGPAQAATTEGTDPSFPSTEQGPAINLPIDIFGSSFFMLSRYEELVKPDRDKHDRFPGRASLAYLEGFLDRPIVDEYTEVLWAAISTLWRRLERKPQTARTIATCDVDKALSFLGGWKQTARRLGGDILKRRSPKSAFSNARKAWRVKKGGISEDPNWTGLQWQLEANEQAGVASTFYFIPTITDQRYENPVSLQSPLKRFLLRDLSRRGHEIGVHPGYQTHKCPTSMRTSVGALRNVLHEEGIEQPNLGGRQHVLRWSTPTTARLLEFEGLTYDSTLSYADRPGFRCGTSREYPLFDLENGAPLKLRERPLILMECSVIADKYLGMQYSEEALDYMLRLREACFRFRGNFTFLWHNSHFNNPQDKEFYRALLTGSA